MPYTTATLAASGWDFVVADVTGFEPAIFNTPDGKRPPGFGEKPSSLDPNWDPRMYTPVDVLIHQTISGPSTPGPSGFLIEGGTVGCYTVHVDVAPRVEVGSGYVFILADVLDAAGENPLTLQEAKFAWPVNAAGMVTTIDGLMSIDELTKLVSKSSASPEPQETTSERPRSGAAR